MSNHCNKTFMLYVVVLYQFMDGQKYGKGIGEIRGKGVGDIVCLCVDC